VSLVVGSRDGVAISNSSLTSVGHREEERARGIGEDLPLRGGGGSPVIGLPFFCFLSGLSWSSQTERGNLTPVLPPD